MRLQFSLKYFMILLLFFFYSCASKPKGEMESIINDSPGALTGLWQGFILPFSLLGKIFNLNIGIHEISYSGTLYWIGFFIGFILLMKLIVFIAVNIEKS